MSVVMEVTTDGSCDPVYITTWWVLLVHYPIIQRWDHMIHYVVTSPLRLLLWGSSSWGCSLCFLLVPPVLYKKNYILMVELGPVTIALLRPPLLQHCPSASVIHWIWTQGPINNDKITTPCFAVSHGDANLISPKYHKFTPWWEWHKLQALLGSHPLLIHLISKPSSLVPQHLGLDVHIAQAHDVIIACMVHIVILDGSMSYVQHYIAYNWIDTEHTIKLVYTYKIKGWCYKGCSDHKQELLI